MQKGPRMSGGPFYVQAKRTGTLPVSALQKTQELPERCSDNGSVSDGGTARGIYLASTPRASGRIGLQESGAWVRVLVVTLEVQSKLAREVVELAIDHELPN